MSLTRAPIHALLGGLLLAAPLVVAGCGDAERPAATNNPGANNGGGKTDTPADGTDLACLKREADAFAGNQSLFTEAAIRWSCADVEGVNNNTQDDRGQEYCEFFAIVQPPPELEGSEVWPAPVDLGRIRSAEPREDGSLAIEVTDLSIDLGDDQIYYLEDHPDAVLGQCVFTAWHSDVSGALGACGDGGPCDEVLGTLVTAERFRMKLPVNSNAAARDLVSQCLTVTDPGDPDDPHDPRHSAFFRGCALTAELFGTEWRRSDPAVCAAATRMAECGCGLPGEADVAAALVPPQPDDGDEGAVTLRGFPLGGWAGPDKLPAGCHRIDLGDGSQTLVGCDLTAADLLDHSGDLKRRCVEKYAGDVVVYVPIPADRITCDPDPDAAFADACTETPWVITGSR